MFASGHRFTPCEFLASVGVRVMGYGCEWFAGRWVAAGWCAGASRKRGKGQGGGQCLHVWFPFSNCGLSLAAGFAM